MVVVKVFEEIEKMLLVGSFRFGQVEWLISLVLDSRVSLLVFGSIFEIFEDKSKLCGSLRGQEKFDSFGGFIQIQWYLDFEWLVSVVELWWGKKLVVVVSFSVMFSQFLDFSDRYWVIGVIFMFIEERCIFFFMSDVFKFFLFLVKVQFVVEIIDGE